MNMDYRKSYIDEFRRPHTIGIDRDTGNVFRDEWTLDDMTETARALVLGFILGNIRKSTRINYCWTSNDIRLLLIKNEPMGISVSVTNNQVKDAMLQCGFDYDTNPVSEDWCFNVHDGDVRRIYEIKRNYGG
jgi:hypothetical protein